MASLKDKLKKYGRTGIAVYLGLSFCVTCGAHLCRTSQLQPMPREAASALTVRLRLPLQVSTLR